MQAEIISKSRKFTVQPKLQPGDGGHKERKLRVRVQGTLEECQMPECLQAIAEQWCSLLASEGGLSGGRTDDCEERTRSHQCLH